MGERIRDPKARVQVWDMALALALLEAIATSRHAVQFTTYPEPRLRGGPAATLDFNEEGWIVDVTRLVRDLATPLRVRTLDGTSEDYAHTMSEAAADLTADAYHHTGREELPLGAARRLLAVMAHASPAATLDSVWRVAGREGLLRTMRDVARGLGAALWADEQARFVGAVP